MKLHVDFENFIANYLGIPWITKFIFWIPIGKPVKAEIYQKTSTCVGSLIVIFKLQIKAKLMLVMYCEKKDAKKYGVAFFHFSRF